MSTQPPALSGLLRARVFETRGPSGEAALPRRIWNVLDAEEQEGREQPVVHGRPRVAHKEGTEEEGRSEASPEAAQSCAHGTHAGGNASLSEAARG